MKRIEPLTDVCLAGIKARNITLDPTEAVFDRHQLLQELERTQRELRHERRNAEQLRIAFETLRNGATP